MAEKLRLRQVVEKCKIKREFGDGQNAEQSKYLWSPDLAPVEPARRTWIWYNYMNLWISGILHQNCAQSAERAASNPLVSQPHSMSTHGSSRGATWPVDWLGGRDGSASGQDTRSPESSSPSVVAWEACTTFPFRWPFALPSVSTGPSGPCSIVLSWPLSGTPSRAGLEDSKSPNIVGAPRTQEANRVGERCLYLMLCAVWPSTAHIPNHLPASEQTSTKYMMSFFVFWFFQLVGTKYARLRWKNAADIGRNLLPSA